MVVGELLVQTDVVVLGAGVAGRTAALWAARLGREVTLVDLPSPDRGALDVDRALALLLDTLEPAIRMARRRERGLTRFKRAVKPAAVLGWVQHRLEAEARAWQERLEEAGVTAIQGEAAFAGPTEVRISTEHGAERLVYEALVLAPEPVAQSWPGLDFDGERVLGPEELLTRPHPPEALTVVAAHPWGLELATAYAGLGTSVQVVVPRDENPVAGFPQEWAEAVQPALTAQGIRLRWGVDDPVAATAQEPLVVVAAAPGLDLGTLAVDQAGIELVDAGLVRVDERLRTRNPRIWAAGAAAGARSPGEARQQGRVAAEGLAGRVAIYTPQAVPRLLRTVPGLAGAGLTPQEARRQGYHVVVGQATVDDVTVQVVTDEHEPFVLGLFARGEGVADLAGEAALAVEMAATLTDLAETLHPAGTPGAALQQAAEALLLSRES